MASLILNDDTPRFTAAYAHAIGRDQAEMDTLGLLPALDFTWREDLDDALLVGSIAPEHARTLLCAYHAGYDERAAELDAPAAHPEHQERTHR